jgi:hypothetical protein
VADLDLVVARRIAAGQTERDQQLGQRRRPAPDQLLVVGADVVDVAGGAGLARVGRQHLLPRGEGAVDVAAPVARQTIVDQAIDLVRLHGGVSRRSCSPRPGTC